MDRRKTLLGVLLIAVALCVMNVVAVMTFPTGQKEEGGEHERKAREHAVEEKEKPIESVAGKCFQNDESRFFFYTDRYLVITALGTTEFGRTFEQRNWYEYSIKDDVLKLKNGEDSFSCPYRAEVEAIVIDGERYVLDKEIQQENNRLIGRTYAGGGQSFHFISDDTVVVTLEDKKITEAWGYAVEGERISFTYGTGVEEQRQFEVTDKGIWVYENK